MAKQLAVVDAAWAEDWAEAPEVGAPFFHGGGLSAEVLNILKQKGYRPIDFRPLKDLEKIEAMIAAAQNGVFDPNPAQTKLIDLHIKHLKETSQDESPQKAEAVGDFLDLLQDFTSKTRPEWSKVGVTPTSTPKAVPKNFIDDLLATL